MTKSADENIADNNFRSIKGYTLTQCEKGHLGIMNIVNLVRVVSIQFLAIIQFEWRSNKAYRWTLNVG